MKNKTNLILLLVIIVVVLIAGCVHTPRQTPEQKTPQNQVSQSYETLNISLGEEFILYENQSAIIVDDNYEIKVISFYNSPCSEGTRCIWSGVGISFEHFYNDEVKKGINLVRAFGYQTVIIDTDHETSVRLKIIKMNNP